MLKKAILALAVLSFLPTGSPGAQDGVAGATPVFSAPSKPPEKETKPAKPPADIRVTSNLVVTPVTVLDRSGEFVYDLTESEFQLLDNGAAQRIVSFESEARPVAMVIVIQTSRSVAALLDDVRPLAPVFSSLLIGDQGQGAVITYDERVRVVQDFSSDGEDLKIAFLKIQPQGFRSRLNDALMRGVVLLEKRPKTDRRVIVAFSDGYDSGSETKGEEVIKRATGSEVAIYGLGFNPAHALLSRKPELPPPGPLDTNVTRPTPPGRAPTPSTSTNVYDAPVPIVDIMVATGEIIRSAVASSLLEFYAGYTGGVFYSHWKKKSVEGQLSRIGTEIHSQYELVYVPDTLTQGGFHRIEVQVRRPGMKVRARAGYFYQPPAAGTQEAKP